MPMPTAAALIRAIARYDALGYHLPDDALLAVMDANGVACGQSWIPRTKKCSKEKAKSTPKENLKRTTEKGKARQTLRAEVEKRPNRQLQFAAQKGAANEIKPSRLSDRKHMLKQIGDWDQYLKGMAAEANELGFALEVMEDIKKASAELSDMRKKVLAEQRNRLENTYKEKVDRLEARILGVKKQVFETMNPRKLVRAPKGTTQRQYRDILDRLERGDKDAIKQYTVPRPKGYKTGSDRAWAKKQAAQSKKPRGKRNA